ncbi:Gfo/Idh/MocA family protein [Phycisphaerales bacterium AB-hyl4]|uniref:Gfo/Idh/MocA family protein n=1 Tax=Natronomicrosphaera hydrolytica TaxID=3242702 RepID=A0ABV4U9B2_9BACT
MAESRVGGAYRVGVVGCGMVAQRHMSAISSSPRRWTLAAVADVDRSRAEASAKQWGADRVFEDYRELLDEVELDALVVATHAETHAAIAMSAMERDVHVLCEKPMASNAEQCREMVTAAERSKGLLAVNFNTRSGEAYRLIKREIDAGRLGTVRVVRFVYDWSNHQWTPTERLEHFMNNGGPITDSGVHFFEGIRWYTGAEFASIDAHGVVLPPYEHPQHVVASCSMTDGAVGLVEVGWLYCKRTKDMGSLFQITVIGDEGTADFDADRGTLKVYDQQGSYESKKMGMDKQFDRIFEWFAQSIQAGRLIELASAEDGLRATEAAYAALASAHRHTSARPAATGLG